MRVPIDTMPLASRALLNVAEKEHVWDGDSLPDRRFVCLFPSLAAMPKSPTTTPCSSMAKVTAGNRELTEKGDGVRT